MSNRELFHRVVFFIALMLLLIGIPFCRPFMSIGGGTLVVNWFLEGRYRNKWKQLTTNRILLASLCLFFIYVFWFVFTDNYSEAWKDIWMKIPLLFIPLILATTKPLSTKEFHNLLKVYLIGVLISTIYGYSMYHVHDWFDKREMAIFISYIRFEMNICFAIFVSFYLIGNDKTYKWQKYVLLLPIFWFLYLILYIGALTAIIIFVVVLCALVLKKAIENRNKLHSYVYISLCFLILGAGVVYSYVNVKQYYAVDFNIVTADKLTADGHPYTHHIENGLIENGSYVFSFVSEEEMAEAWNHRSPIPFDNYDVKGQHQIKNTLIRYLNSKGLRKDRIGVESLTKEDVFHIEQGVANVLYTNHLSLKSRFYSLLWEFSDYKANGTVSSYTLP